MTQEEIAREKRIQALIKKQANFKLTDIGESDEVSARMRKMKANPPGLFTINRSENKVEKVALPEPVVEPEPVIEEIFPGMPKPQGFYDIDARFAKIAADEEAMMERLNAHAPEYENEVVDDSMLYSSGNTS